MYEGTPRFWSNKLVPDTIRDLGSTSWSSTGTPTTSPGERWPRLSRVTGQRSTAWPDMRWVVYSASAAYCLVPTQTGIQHLGEYTALTASSANRERHRHSRLRNMRIEFQANEGPRCSPEPGQEVRLLHHQQRPPDQAAGQGSTRGSASKLRSRCVTRRPRPTSPQRHGHPRLAHPRRGPHPGATPTSTPACA